MSEAAHVRFKALAGRWRRAATEAMHRARARAGSAPLYRPAAFTAGAPHVRDTMNLARMRALQVAALVPVLLVGVWNSGYQAAAALIRLEREAPDGWRGGLAAVPGWAMEPNDPWAAVVLGLSYYVPVFLVALVAGGLCLSAFSAARQRPVSPGLLLTVLLFTLALPPTISLWKVALGIVFGLVIGQEVFGGPGRNFLNPALVGVVFLYLAYPAALRGDSVWVAVEGWSEGTALARVRAGGAATLGADGSTWLQSLLGCQPGAFGDTSALACAIGAAFLCYARLISWRILAGGISGLLAVPVVFNLAGGAAPPLAEAAWYWHLTVGSFAFALVYFATDPVTTPSTAAGRWTYGVLIGAMTSLVRLANPSHTEGVMLAILLGNTSAPLIDYFAVRRHARRRAHRNA